MANLATGIIVAAGTITFANSWYQTKQVNWKIPIATALLGAAFDGLSHLDDKAAVGLSVMVMIGSLVTRFDGKSVADTIAETIGNPKQNKAPARHTVGAQPL